jgi:hypothetical protein
MCPGRDAAFFTLLRRTGTVTNAAFITAPALQRTASQELRAALRPGHDALAIPINASLILFAEIAPSRAAISSGLPADVLRSPVF